MKILIVEDEVELLEIFSLWFKTNLKADVVCCSSYDSAVKAVQECKTFDLIISDYRLASNTGLDLLRFVRTQGLRVPFILCSGSHHKELPITEDCQPTGFLQKPFRIIELQKMALGILFNTVETDKPREEANAFAPIAVSCSFLQFIGELPCDVLVKLGEDKFVKVLNKKTLFDSTEFQRFTLKGISTLYVSLADAELSLLSCLESLAQMRMRIEPLGTAMRCSIEAQGLIHSMVRQLGVGQQVMDAIREVTTYTMQVITGCKELAPHLTIITEYPDSYVSSHSVVLSHLSCAIADAAGWTSKYTFHMLIITSLLHDLTIHSDGVARIQNQHELIDALTRLGPAAESEWQGHGAEAAKLISYLHDVPEGADTMIRYHHERPNGTGPLGMTADQISPTAALISLSHEILNELYLHGPEANILNFLNKLDSSYYEGSYKAVTLAAIACATKASASVEQ